MKAKDKAQRLVETYTIKLPPQSAVNLKGYSVAAQGKLIAAMVCNAMIDECNYLNAGGGLNRGEWIARVKYWDDVLNEIQHQIFH